MVFDSKTFLVFFAVVFTIYHALGRWFRAQNVFLLAASLVFYGWWDWRFLFLLLATAGLDYVAGMVLDRTGSERTRRLILLASLVANLGVLFTFKYFDFFATSLRDALALVGVNASLPLLRVVLPVGVSFYTFQSMAYTIDVYRREFPAERNPVSFFLFVSLFPHMVAGPIQRASHLLDQVNRPRRVTEDDVREAVWLCAYGFFLKVLIADSAATFADAAFREDQTSGWMTILGTLAFAIQIYCDFNAYSILARGTGKLLGFEFIWNFNQPYYAGSIQDFWRRWHISLSTWLRDYLYISLGGNRRGRRRTYFNLFMTMVLGGLWHGAAWNFVLWGMLHGGALAVHKRYRESVETPMPFWAGWSLTMLVVLVGWFLFRCQSWRMISAMTRALANLEWTAGHTRILASLAVLALPVWAIERWQFRARDLLAPLAWPRWRLATLTGAFTFVAFVMFGRLRHAFIYFQF